MPVYCSLHHENPDGSAFCDECGEPLAGAAPVAAAPGASVEATSAPAAAPVAGGQACPSCGAINAVGEAFCANCGVNLLGAPAAPPATPTPAAPASAPAPVM